MAKDVIARNWTCKFCGYNRTSIESYYKFRKAYNAHYQASEKHREAWHKFYDQNPQYTKPVGVYT